MLTAAAQDAVSTASPCQQADATNITVNRIPFVEDDAEISDDRHVYKSQAVREWSEQGQRELCALADLTNKHCSCTPNLIKSWQYEQNDTLWVPGGFIFVCLMTFLPGIDLGTYWDPDVLPRSERDEIRAALKKSLV